METFRITLVFLHIITTIFAVVNLHPHLSLAANAADHQKLISAIVGYSNDLIRISFYHTACIIAVWFCRRYGASMIRASGILLISELFQVIVLVIKVASDTDYVASAEQAFYLIHNLSLLVAIWMTFRLADKISIRENNLIQVELLAETGNDALMDVDIEFNSL